MKDLREGKTKSVFTMSMLEMLNSINRQLFSTDV
jgi:hypothetical protein